MNHEIFTHETVPHSTGVWFSIPQPRKFFHELAQNSLLTKILPPKNTRYTVVFYNFVMKSMKVQTLGKVALHATTACTNDRSIVATQLGCSLVPCLGLHVVGSVHIDVCTYYSLLRAYAYAGPLSHKLYGRACIEVYVTLQREQNGGLELIWFNFVKNVPLKLLVPWVRRILAPVHRLAPAGQTQRQTDRQTHTGQVP